MFRLHRRRHVGSLRRRSDRELAGVLLALIDTGCVVAYPADSMNAVGLHNLGEYAWAMRRTDDGPSVIRDLPGGRDRGRDRRGFDYPSHAALLCYGFLDEEWIVLGEPSEHGVRTVTLTGLGEEWLNYSRGNTHAFDLALLPAIWTAIEVERAAFRVYCEDRGIKHGHADA